MNPKARTKDIHARELDGELVVYDRDRRCTHHLNASAARVYRQCDGRHSVDDLSSLFSQSLTQEGASEIVKRALTQMCHAGLLDRQLLPATELRWTRRGLLTRLAAAGVTGFILPAVATVALADPAIRANNCPSPLDIDANITSKPPRGRKRDALQDWNKLAYQKCKEECAKYHCRTDDDNPTCESDPAGVFSDDRKPEAVPCTEPKQWVYKSTKLTCDCECPPKEKK